MKKIAFLFALIVSTFCFSQSYIEGYIYDKETNEPLPYATIKFLNNNNYYTITNEDGKFEIKSDFPADSLEVRFLGFKTKKVQISFFKKNVKLFLSPNSFELNQVVVIVKKDKNYAYKLLANLIKKYRKKTIVTKSKAFLTLTSSALDVPIEIIEGFYNSEQNLSKGIVDLKLKSGRFGQNKSFPFYSLNNTDILKDFQLFEKTNQILPQFPGNSSLKTLKGKYNVKINQCENCSYDDLLISFVPKKINGRLFSGNILFNKKLLIIKKIELNISNPVIKKLTSINEDVSITPKDIKLSINFDPINREKIQSLDFTFKVYYKSLSSSRIINSHSFLYFYDYNNPFEEPYFTNTIRLDNDYDKIIALQASDDFWNANYQFPKSYSEIKAIDYFKKYGYLFNYENTISFFDIKYTNPSVISWSKDKRLEWRGIKQNIVQSKKDERPSNSSFVSNMRAKSVPHSASQMELLKPSLKSNEKFNFSYILDSYKNNNSEEKFVTRTLFDRNSSFYLGSKSKEKLIYLNIAFDIYEYYRRQLDEEITKELTFNEAKKLVDAKFKKASITVKKMKKETNAGLNFQNLIKWNNNLKRKINIDNFQLIENTSHEKI